MVAKGYACTITYSTVKDTIRITRQTASGNTRTLFHVPTYAVLNVETAAEADARQRLRQANDDTIKLAFAESGAGTATLFCTIPDAHRDGNNSNSLVFGHSRANTGLSTPGYASLHQRAISNCGASSPDTHFAPPTAPVRFSIHYIRQRGKEYSTIHSLEIQSSGSAEALRTLVAAVLQRVYVRGLKHIVVFISAKSGRGRGPHIFNKHVRPLLHFSRHSFHVITTKRAHDCEDYIADIDNQMDSNTVIAVAGGDGMVHEAVNGLHRRKLALLRWMRGFTIESTHGAPELCGPSSASVTSSCADCLALPINGEDISSPSPKVSLTLSHSISSQKNENKDGVMSQPKWDATTAARSAEAARRMATRLLAEGWDNILPVVATVPTGSACGLAKSMEVLSVVDAALSLIHLQTCRMDLLNMHFTPNEEMVEFHSSRMSGGSLSAAARKFNKYEEHRQEELMHHRKLTRRLNLPNNYTTSEDSVAPFFTDGGPRYRDAVCCSMGVPEFRNRVAFMSLSFGMANDIDHGSEHLRWMGNARFGVYGGYAILRGLRRYNGLLRYLPWEGVGGQKVEKLHRRQKIPSEEDLPVCTMRHDCPHCVSHATEWRVGNTDMDELPKPLANSTLPAGGLLASHTDSELLGEDAVDFDNPDLPWVTIRGDFYNILLCNIRDVAQDMIMAPLSHLSDGCIDVVFCREDPSDLRGGRKELLKFFLALEEGKHIHYDFVNYVKARALEIKIDAGISMSDGELMPMSSVRMTKLRNSVQLVRKE